MPTVTTALPKSWPVEVKYLTQPVFSKSTPASLLRVPRKSIDNSVKEPILKQVVTPYTSIKITLITNPSHPAKGQHGLFTTKNLPPDTFICFYLGYVHGNDETDPTSNYDLNLDNDLQLAADATHMGNESRFINDYRGIREEGPNAEFRDCYLDVGNGMVEKRTGVFVLSARKAGKFVKPGKGGRAAEMRERGILKGEEILVNYGKGYWAHRGPDGTK